MIRALDLMEAALEAREHSVPKTHWPSSASAWLPCETCGGAGRVDNESGGMPCPDCDGTGKVLHGSCMRALFWKYRGEPVTNHTKAGGYLKMGMGDKAEELILDLVAPHMPMIRQHEIWLRPDALKMPIHGYVDGVAIDPETGSLIVVEMKSTFMGGWKSVRDNGVKIEWWMQNCLYVEALRRQYPKNSVDFVKYFVLDRGKGDRAEFDKVANGDTLKVVVNGCVARWAELEAALEKDALPEAEYATKGKKHYGHWRCNWCDYADKCKGLSKGE